MGHTQESKIRNRDRILEVASKQVREKGLEALAIADLMNRAALTPGGFYKHFASRDDLIAQAVESAIIDSTSSRRTVDMRSLVDGYLSAQHRDTPGSGCAFSALAVDVGRADARTKEVFTRQLQQSLQTIAGLAEQAGGAGDLKGAMVQMSAMLGALILARAVDDPTLSDALLKATRDHLNISSPLAPSSDVIARTE